LVLNENELMLVFWFIYFGTWTFLKESAKAQVQAYQICFFDNIDGILVL